MLRILHITESCTAGGGGTSTAFVEMVEALRTRPEACLVRAATQIMPEGDEARRWIAHHEPGTWTFTPHPGRLRPAGMCAALRSLIDSFNPTVLSVHGLWCTDIVAAALHAQARRIPVAWHTHGMLVHAALRRARLKKALFKALWLSRTLSRASAVVFTSANERDTSDLALPGPGVRPVILPLPVHIAVPEADLPALRREGRAALGLSDTTPLISFIGRLHPVKRIELALDALAHAHARGSHARLVLIGAGEAPYTQSLREHAARRGVTDHVIFVGWQNGRAKLATLAAADTMAFCSEFENFGYALVESLSLHVPVVATANLSLAPDMAAAGAGWSSAPTPDALGATLHAALTTPPDRRATMGRAGRAWVQASFSREAVGRQMMEMYAGLRAA